MKKSKRSNVDPFIVMDVMESARKAEANGKHVIHMEVGQPGTPAPKRAKQFISDEISNNNLGYTVTLGLPELRNRISKLYGDCLLYTSPSPRDLSTSRMPSSA